jgi:putative membrane protein
MGWAGGWDWWWIFPLMMLVMMGLCAFGMFRHMVGGGHRRSSALRILQERFARGDIQKAEYDEKKAVLLSGDRP